MRAVVVGVLLSVGGVGCNRLDTRSGAPIEIVLTNEPSTDVSGGTSSTAVAMTSSLPSCSERIDMDGDGFTVSPAPDCKGFVPSSVTERADCDDSDPHLHLFLYPDEDGDGTGMYNGRTCLRESAPGYAPNSDDCDDADPRRSSVAPEVSYDGFDSNCDGYDVQVSRRTDTPIPLSVVDGAPWCEGPVLGVVTLHMQFAFLAKLQIANVGTESVSGASLLVTRYDSTFSVGGDAEVLDVPALSPGESHMTELFHTGNYSVMFSDAVANPLDAGLVETTFDQERCERARAPFQFQVFQHNSL